MAMSKLVIILTITILWGGTPWSDVIAGVGGEAVPGYAGSFVPSNAHITPPSYLVTTNTMPEFVEPMANVTVPVGREVTFQCVVKNLNSHRIAWFHKEKHTVLAFGEQVITRNARLRVTSHAGSTFALHISDVREEDRGQYMCQINTQPMKSQAGHLNVVVPPRIMEDLTSSDLEVREDSPAQLRCAAYGSPKPDIRWKREDDEPIHFQYELNNANSYDQSSSNNALSMPLFPPSEATNRKVVYGELLELNRTTRLHMGAYICIADNRVPPAVSKRIFLGVTFAPMIWTAEPRVAAYIGQAEVILSCILESYPQGSTYWAKHGGQSIIVANHRYNPVLLDSSSVPSLVSSSSSAASYYRAEMRLVIKEVKPNDFTSYTCVARNELNEARGTIRLYEVARPAAERTTPPPTTSTTSTSTAPPSSTTPYSHKGHARNKKDFMGQEIPSDFYSVPGGAASGSGGRTLKPNVNSKQYQPSQNYNPRRNAGDSMIASIIQLLVPFTLFLQLLNLCGK